MKKASLAAARPGFGTAPGAPARARAQPIEMSFGLDRMISEMPASNIEK